MKKIYFVIYILTHVVITIQSIRIDINFSSLQPNVLSEINKDFKYPEKIGEPAIPFVSKQIVLPFGHRIKEINYTSSNDYVEIDFQIPPIQPNATFTHGTFSYEFDNDIYSQNEYYPNSPYELMGVHRKNGVDIAVIRIYQYQYNPINEDLIAHKNLALSIQTEYLQEIATEQSKMLLNPDKLSASLSALNLENSELISTYFNQNQNSNNHRTSLVSPSNPYKYIIISPSNYSTEWATFINHKANLGVNVEVFLTSDIYANYSGRDNAEKVRNFIIDAYTSWSGTATPLEYVLMGGDFQEVPVRYVKVTSYYNSAWNQNSLICDQYFSNLDGDWDNDADNRFGEGDSSLHIEATGTAGDEADYLAELSIGRASSDDVVYLQNWINKTITYENSIIGADYLKRTGLIGEYLGGGAWGGDHQDEIETFIPDFYTTKLYANDGSFNKTNVTNLINNGVNIISHIGHGRSSNVLSLYEGDVDTLLTNTDYCFIYTQACGTANIGYINAIGEILTKYPHGAFAYIGNTHYGFYSSFFNQGSNQLCNREFFDAIMNEGIVELGRANTDSKEDIIDLVGTVGTMRQTYLELMLFGDPILTLHKDVATLSAEQTGSTEVTLHLDDFTPDNTAYSGTYTVYERDNSSSVIGVSNISVSGSDIILSLSSAIPEGIPFSVDISGITGVSGVLTKNIAMLSNIIELSVITNDTWTISNSPYYVYKYLFVKNSLNIEPGVEVRVNSDIGIYIYDNGNLNASGTQENPIIFSSYDPTSTVEGDWVDITFHESCATSGNSLSHCIVKNASSGVWVDSTAVVSISDCMIINSPDYGFYSYYGNQTLSNTIIAFNNGSVGENGVYFEGVNSVVSNLTFSGNDIADFTVIDSDLQITNSIIRGLNGSIIDTGSTLQIDYSNIDGGYPGTGNIDMDPMFNDPDSNDYSLDANSPCIDTGDEGDDSDPDDTIPDMGAVYYDHPISFSALFTRGDAPIDVSFTNESEGSPTLIQWDFDNDGAWDANGDNPSFEFNSPGRYDVVLRLEKSSWSDTLIVEDCIIVTDNQLDSVSNPIITSTELNWDNDTNAEYYLIYSSENPYSNFGFYDYTTSNQTLISDTEEKIFFQIKKVMTNP